MVYFICLLFSIQVHAEYSDLLFEGVGPAEQTRQRIKQLTESAKRDAETAEQYKKRADKAKERLDSLPAGEDTEAEKNRLIDLYNRATETQKVFEQNAKDKGDELIKLGGAA